MEVVGEAAAARAREEASASVASGGEVAGVAMAMAAASEAAISEAAARSRRQIAHEALETHLAQEALGLV